MTICMARKVLEEIHAHAEATYPNECCGLLVEDTKRDAISAPPSPKTIRGSIRMSNDYEGPKHDRYNINPLKLYKVDRALTQRGLSIAGIYHSHPDHPASFSPFDLKHSIPWYSYIVVSVPNGRAADTRSWISREDKSVMDEGIEILG
jgi:proteasome lid subunit RPN8/RPN11